MKKIILILILASITSAVYADGYTETRPYEPNRTYQYNSNGQEQGYTEQHPYEPNRVYQYNQNGQQQGYYEQHPYEPNRTYYHSGY
jgi:hypothetical protein